MKYMDAKKIGILFLLLSGINTMMLAQEKYKITGSVTGLADGKIYLYNNGKAEEILVSKGTFHLENTMEEQVSNITILKSDDLKNHDPKGFLSVYVEPKVMTLQLNYDDFTKAKLTGSKTQDDNYRYESTVRQIKSKYKTDVDKVAAARKKYEQAVEAKKGEDIIEAIKFEESDAKEKLEPMNKQIKAVTFKFIKDNPKSFISLNLLWFSLIDLKYEEAITYFQALSVLNKNSQTGTMVLAQIEKMKKAVPGTVAPVFSTVDINGNPLKLEDFKGRYVLIDFWASWCVPCRKGSPHLLKLYSEYKSKGLEIVGVSDDDRTIELWKKAVDKDGTGVWRHVLRGLKYKEGTYERINIENDISNSYNITSLPTKILVDPQGIVVGRYSAGEEDDKKMDHDLEAIFSGK